MSFIEPLSVIGPISIIHAYDCIMEMVVIGRTHFLQFLLKFLLSQLRDLAIIHVLSTTCS
jgi:hypothetical protein